VNARKPCLRPKTLEAISEEELVGNLWDMTQDERRPAIRLQAIKVLMELKGVTRGGKAHNAPDPVREDELDVMVEGLLQRRSSRGGS